MERNKIIKKIIKYHKHEFYQEYPKDSLFILGPISDSDKRIRGIFILFNSPIVKKANYISCIDFKQYSGLCYTRHLFWLRKNVRNVIKCIFDKRNAVYDEIH